MVTLHFDGAGAVTAIYEDAEKTLGADVKHLQRVADVRTRRASHVEPNDAGQWEADMAPMGGPVLGPFDLRAEALAAEHAWLEAHL